MYNIGGVEKVLAKILYFHIHKNLKLLYMSLCDALIKMFFPQIIREYDKIIIDYNEAVKRWNNNSGLINTSSLENYSLSFKDKKTIVSHKKEIVKINDEIRKEKYDRIKREFPLGFKCFIEENRIKGHEKYKIDFVLSRIEEIKKYQIICSKYEKIIIDYREAVERWNKDSGMINMSSLENYSLSFKEKRAIVDHKDKIIEIDGKIRKEKEKEYHSIKGKYPLGVKCFEENFNGVNKIDGVLSNIEKIKRYQTICAKYESLKEQYPLGFAAFLKENSLADGKNYDILTIEKIIAHEEDICNLNFQCLFEDDEYEDEEEEFEEYEEEEGEDEGEDECEEYEEEDDENEEYNGFADLIDIDDKQNSITHFTSRGKETEALEHWYYYKGGWRCIEVEEEYKDDKKEILNILKKNNVECFYHFTSKENLSSIKELGGLFSWHYLKSHNIEIPDQGGDDLSEYLDRSYGLQDYVRLSLCKSHPMAYRKKQEGSDIVVLKISIEVAKLKDTLFSDMNAADKLHSHGGDVESLKKINFAATKRECVRSNDPDFKYMQAEIMVKTFLPIKYILNIDSL